MSGRGSRRQLPGSSRTHRRFGQRCGRPLGTHSRLLFYELSLLGPGPRGQRRFPSTRTSFLRSTRSVCTPAPADLCYFAQRARTLAADFVTRQLLRAPPLKPPPLTQSRQWGGLEALEAESSFFWRARKCWRYFEPSLFVDSNPPDRNTSQICARLRPSLKATFSSSVFNCRGIRKERAVSFLMPITLY